MLFTRRLYLDSAAAAPVTKDAQRAFVRALSFFGNPDSVHTEGQHAKAVLEEARTTIARLSGVKSDHVVFTKGATDANNIAIFGVIEKEHMAGTAYADMHVLYLDGAHASIQEPLQHLASLGVSIEKLSVAEGKISLEEVERKLQQRTVLVSLERVTSEIGMCIDTRDVKRVLEKAGSKAVLHVDASQMPLIDSIERTHLGADILTLDAQKVGGVRGIGALIMAPQITLVPYMFGGGQEKGLSSGTPSPALASAFATALSLCEKNRKAFVEHSKRIRAVLTKQLSHVDQLVVNEGHEQAPHIVNVSVRGRDTDYLQALLNHAGYAVSTKSACESGEEGSRGVLARTGDSERARTTIRISWSHRVPLASIKKFSRAFSRAVSFIDQHRL